MGCSVSKQDIRPKSKYPFLPEDYREVRTEAVMKKQKEHSEPRNPAHRSEQQASQLNFEVEKHKQQLKDSKKPEPQKQNISSQNQAQPVALPVVVQEAKSPLKQNKQLQNLGTQKQPYRPILVPNIRGITKPALPDFQPAKQSCNFARGNSKRGENQTSLLRSTSKISLSKVKTNNDL